MSQVNLLQRIRQRFGKRTVRRIPNPGPEAKLMETVERRQESLEVALRALEKRKQVAKTSQNRRKGAKR